MIITGRAQARHSLDAHLDRLRPWVGEPRPHRGWIRALRDALGMSTTEMAARMGVAQQAITELERSELHATIRLETLGRAAEALDCDLVYALVPRRSLDEAVTEQGRRRAMRLLDQVAHHSRLEDQTVSESATASQLDELAARFIDRRGLWTEPDSQ